MAIVSLVYFSWSSILHLECVTSCQKMFYTIIHGSIVSAFVKSYTKVHIIMFVTSCRPLFYVATMLSQHGLNAKYVTLFISWWLISYISSRQISICIFRVWKLCCNSLLTSVQEALCRTILLFIYVLLSLFYCFFILMFFNILSNNPGLRTLRRLHTTSHAEVQHWHQCLKFWGLWIWIWDEVVLFRHNISGRTHWHLHQNSRHVLPLQQVVPHAHFYLTVLVQTLKF